MNWETKWTGKMWLAQQSVQPDGRIFERVMRAPGSRIMIVNDGKILLNREKRTELGGAIDYRLPGGKVFDTNGEYQEFLKSQQDITEASRQSIAREALEETGIIVDPLKLEYLGVDILGTTCTWDLHYWLATQFTEHIDGAQFHESESEEILGFVWLSVADAAKLALDSKQFSESRSALKIIQLEKRHEN